MEVGSNSTDGWTTVGEGEGRLREVRGCGSS